MSEPLYIGSVARCEADVYDNMVDPRALADPTTLTLTVTAVLTGTVSTYTLAGGTVVRVSEGVYYALHTCVSSGVHRLKWVSTGSNAAATVDTFTVLPDA